MALTRHVCWQQGSHVAGRSTRVHPIAGIFGLGFIGSIVGFGASNAILALQGAGPGSEDALIAPLLPLFIIAVAVVGSLAGLGLYVISRNARAAGIVAFAIPFGMWLHQGLTFVNY